MFHVACSGFPVPTSRYFQECRAVEISDTELGIPGDGTRRRWLREAPPGFVFTVLAPKSIGGSGFALNAETKSAVDEIAGFGKLMKSHAVVFAAAETFQATKPNRARVRAFAEHAQSRTHAVVLDLPGWSLAASEAALAKLDITLAFDPLSESPTSFGALAYLRLPGPSGYRSRYDSTALDRVVEYSRSCPAENVVIVFRNVDSFENSRYVAGKLALPA